MNDIEKQKIEKGLRGLERTWAVIAKTPNKDHTLNWHGVNFEVWSTGMCFWTRIWFMLGGKKVYNLERSELTGPSGGNFRKEYFEGRLVRTYEGEQNCFIEFCNLLTSFASFPKSREFKMAGTALKLEGDVVLLYTKMYKKIFGKGR
jgi:hypothetical protein